MVSNASRGMKPVLSIARTLAVLCLAPAHAHAWTEAQVVHVGARIDASHAPNARVELDVGVRVTGGWLSSFEIVGLDPELTLAADKPVDLIAENGVHFSPATAMPEPGTLVMTFPSRSDAPRRGEHVMHIVYDTRALFAQARRIDTQGRATLRMRWALPRWDASLSDVHVDVLAPEGTKVASESSTRSLLDAVSAHAVPNATELGFTRTTLPRTQSFEIVFDVPAPSATAAAVSGTQPASGNSQRTWLVFSVLLGLLVITKRALGRRMAKRENIEVISLLSIPALRHELLRAACVLSACSAFGALADAAPMLSACFGMLGLLLGLDRGFQRKALPLDATTRAATASDFELGKRTRIFELMGATAWLDATTPAGLICLASLYLATFAAGSGHAWLPALASVLLATPLFVTATRLQRPIAAHRLLHHLATLRTGLRDLPARSTLVVHTSADGRLLEARIRFELSSVPAGMGKLELIVTDGSFYGRPRWALSWLAQCRAHSTADSLLQRALQNAVRECGSHDGHIAYLAVTVDVARDAAHLLPWLTRESLARAA